MPKSAHPERETQDRIIKFFQKELGYNYLGKRLIFVDLYDIILQ